MQEEKIRRATADKEGAELAADQFEDQQMRQLGQEADQRGVPLVFPKMPVFPTVAKRW